MILPPPEFHRSYTRVSFSDCQRLPFSREWHLTLMSNEISKSSPLSLNYDLNYASRGPAEPSLPPVQEPPAPPENPDMPVREPDPDMPNQI
jgi:hypothetical protein